MDRLITSSVGGFPLLLNDARFFLGQAGQSQGIYQALNNLLRVFGDNFIVQGATISGGENVAEGWIMLDGELLKVDAHVVDFPLNFFFKKVTTLDPAGNKKAQNGSDIEAYQINRGVASASSGNLPFDGDRYEDLVIPAIRNQENSKATESQKGLIEIATQVEADAGADPLRDITPKTPEVVQEGKIDIVRPVTEGNLVKLKSDGSLERTSTPSSQVSANVTNIGNLDTNKLDKSEFDGTWDTLSVSSGSGNIISGATDGSSYQFRIIRNIMFLDFRTNLTPEIGEDIILKLPAGVTVEGTASCAFGF